MKTNQKERLLNYLIANKEINPLTSWVKLGIYRLSAVIHLLRKEGYNIETEFIKVTNKFGEPCKVANYKLDELELLDK
jgi:hypothetical protein